MQPFHHPISLSCRGTAVRRRHEHRHGEARAGAQPLPLVRPEQNITHHAHHVLPDRTRPLAHRNNRGANRELAWPLSAFLGVICIRSVPLSLALVFL